MPGRCSPGVQEISKSPAAAATSALHELGMQPMQAGRHRDATLCWQQALEADPDHGQPAFDGSSVAAEQYDDVIEWIDRTNRQDPSAEYLVRLFTALAQQGLYREAFKALSAAVEIRPASFGCTLAMHSQPCSGQ
jgi:tetratricopeptide (TPR) repeat protein